MISTRTHGLIDWAVASLFSGAPAVRPLALSVRTALRSASVYHASYAAVTDYEAGLLPWLTMRQHLVLDAIGGAGLVAAGLLMRREAPGDRALLVAAGLAELAVVAFSEAPMAAPDGGPVTYPPVDTLKQVAGDVFVVDSALPGLMGKVLPARMTVIRLATGDLLLHSPVRFTPGLNSQLVSLGRVAHLVAPNIAHWMFLREWQLAYPNVATWAVPGLGQRAQVKRSGVRLDYDLQERAPALWGSTIKLVMVHGGLGFREAALFHQPSGTLVLTDLVVNLELGKLPRMVRPIVRLFGMAAPAGMPPPYVRAVVKLRRRAAARAMASVLDLDPRRVIFAHGRWFESDGAQALRRSLRWLLD